MLDPLEVLAETIQSKHVRWATAMPDKWHAQAEVSTTDLLGRRLNEAKAVVGACHKHDAVLRDCCSERPWLATPLISGCRQDSS